MILFNIADIRLFWSQDPRFLQQFEAGKVTKFEPFSKYPSCWKDISFWIREKPFHMNDMCDIVRDVAGNLAEEITEASIEANCMGGAIADAVPPGRQVYSSRDRTSKYDVPDQLPIYGKVCHLSCIPRSVAHELWRQVADERRG